jgi:6-hydroxynicotinate 3-monooxygenase
MTAVDAALEQNIFHLSLRLITLDEVFAKTMLDQ